MQPRVNSYNGRNRKNSGHLNERALLAYLARGDREVHPSELDYIYKIGRNFGFSDEEIERIIVTENNEFHVTIPQTKSEKLALIYDLLFIMIADGIVSAEEVAIISRVSFLFGIPAIKLKTYYIQFVESIKQKETKDSFLHRMSQIL